MWRIHDDTAGLHRNRHQQQPCSWPIGVNAIDQLPYSVGKMWEFSYRESYKSFVFRLNCGMCWWFHEVSEEAVSLFYTISTYEV